MIVIFDSTISLSEKGFKNIKNDCQEIVTGFEIPLEGDVPLFQIERSHIKQDLGPQDLMIGDTRVLD